MVGVKVVGHTVCVRRWPGICSLPPLLTHGEVENRFLLQDAGVHTLELIVKEAQQLRVYVEDRGRRRAVGARILAGAVVPRTENQPAAILQSAETLDGR